MNGDERILVRPVRVTDAPGLNELRRMPGFEEMLALPSERLDRTEEYVRGLGVNNHEFVAVETRPDGTELIVGSAGLIVYERRRHHCGGIGIVVHPDWRGQGVGTKLMEALLDIADNWLMLVRVELTVYTVNERAQALYRRFGFAEEGVMRKAAIRCGEYADLLMMARVREQV